MDAGINPIEERKAAKAIPTFGEIADKLMVKVSAQFRSNKHLAGWKLTLEGYAKSLRNLPVDQVDTAAVLSVLKPIWTTKPETASRLRGRIERVLNAAKAQGFRSGENPALWRGHLKELLPERNKLSRGHHAAMAYAEVPAFVTKLQERGAMTALALEFLILTCARSGECLGARWGEMDLEAGVWTVPAERMKAGRVHRVPLSPRALAILKAAAEAPTGEFVFPGYGQDRPLSSNALRALLIRMGLGHVTAHGFRSSFRDWAGELSTFPRELAEGALAHKVGDETELAYRRGDALEKRRKLMNAWANYILNTKGNVIPLSKSKAS